MKRYAIGRAMEYEVADLFRRAGWRIMRGAGSKGEVLDWKPDLVVTKWGRRRKHEAWMVLVQIKVRKRSSSSGSGSSKKRGSVPSDGPAAMISDPGG